MPLSPSQIHQMVHTLDPKCPPSLLPIACIVLDVTLNKVTFNPIHLRLRHNCTHHVAKQAMDNILKHHMLTPHWLNEDGTINLIEFWLHVMVAEGTLAVHK